jgi:hypothetical protein
MARAISETRTGGRDLRFKADAPHVTHPCATLRLKSAVFAAESDGFAVESGGRIARAPKSSLLVNVYAKRTPVRTRLQK